MSPSLRRLFFPRLGVPQPPGSLRTALAAVCGPGGVCSAPWGGEPTSELSLCLRLTQHRAEPPWLGTLTPRAENIGEVDYWI